jgi:eukaryotic-like serine/threonine-protein kinase
MHGLERLLLGHVLADRYRIEEVVGRGGMGAVYRARDQRLEREVAVKVVSAPGGDTASLAGLRARFQREARAIAALQHPNVVTVFDVGTDPRFGLDFLVMELLRGEDLASRLLRKGPPAPRTSLSLLHQAALGLAEGHRLGLVHRDVKPGNLFLQPGDQIGEVRLRVLDFGIADLVADPGHTQTHLTVDGRSPLSPAYASPEQLRGLSRLTPATDVFSLGAVGYQLLTGGRAFASADPDRMLAELAGTLAALRSGDRLPAPVRDLLQRALAVHPEDRFPSAAPLAEAIAAALRGSAGTPGSWRRHPGPAPDDPHDDPDVTRLAPDHGAADGSPYTVLAPRDEGRRAFPATALPAAHPAEGRRGALPAPPAGGGLRRALGTAWSAFLTAASVGLLLGSWALMGMGQVEPDWGMAAIGVVGGALFAPLAVHRLGGRRGKLGLTRLASFAATVGVYLLAGPGWELGQLLAAIGGAQLLLSILVEALVRRPERDSGPDPDRPRAG